MLDIDRARGILDRDFLSEMEQMQRELAALREFERVVMVHDHGKGTPPGVTHYPCSICSSEDDVQRVRRRAA